MNAAEYVLAGGLAAAGRDKPAIVSGDESVSYGELAVRVSRFAAALRESGMTPGDRVAILMLDHSDLVALYLAIIAAGGIAITVSTRATSDDLRHILAIVRPFAVVAESDFVEALAAGMPPGATVGDGIRALCAQAGRSGLLGDDLRHDRTAEGGRAPA
jgi:acyl-CoA synthetase (AMP-forming)/AMP-acid ligase II